MIEALKAKHGEPRQVLDHGFVRLVDVMGDTDAVCRAARVSYGKGTKTKRDNRALVRYLMRNGHWSPLEMAEMVIHLRLPIFVARQFVRHGTLRLNEVSARYSEVPAEYYVPEPERVQAQSVDNKQGSGEQLAVDIQTVATDAMTYLSQSNVDGYGHLLGSGVARELSRIVLPQNMYTEWYWKGNLRNWLMMLRQRLHRHAQWETRQYAKVIADIVREWVPDVWEAFEDYTLHAHTFSRQEMELLRSQLWGFANVLDDGYCSGSTDRRLFDDSEGRPGLRSLLDEHDIGTKRERAAFLRALGVIDG